MQISRAIVLGALGFAMLSVAACADSPQPQSQSQSASAGGASSQPPLTKAAVNLPTKAELAVDYDVASSAFNEILSKSWPEIEAGTTLGRGNGIGSAMANANWKFIERIRAMRASIEVPGGDYPTDKTFYTDLYSTLGQAIDKALRQQELWTRLRDATTAAEFNAALDDPAYEDDGVVQRRLRSLLGLPDVPQI